MNDEEITDIRISEEEAMNTILPLFTIDLLVTDAPDNEGGIKDKPTTNPAWFGNSLSFYIKQIKIAARHENDKYSEVYVGGKVGFIPNPLNYSQNYIKPFFGTDFNQAWKNQNYELKRIHKNNINWSTVHNVSQSFWIYSNNPSNILHTHEAGVIILYERDWIHTAKPFGWVKNDDPSMSYGVVVYQSSKINGVWGHAKYLSDYYYEAPATNTDGNLAVGLNFDYKENTYNNNGYWKTFTNGAVYTKIQ